MSANADGTVLFTVQHHLVTDSGDTIFFDQATAVTMPLSQSLFAVSNHPVHISGGTGKYAKARGEVDLGGEQTVFRYFGKVCLLQQGD